MKIFKVKYKEGQLWYYLLLWISKYIPISSKLNVDLYKGCVTIPESLNSRSLNSQG